MIEMYSELPVQFKECNISEFSAQKWYENVLDGIKYHFINEQDMPTVFFWACAHPFDEMSILLGLADIHLFKTESDPLVSHIPAMMEMFDAFACILVRRTVDMQINPLLSFGEDAILERDCVMSMYEDVDGNSLASYYDIKPDVDGIPRIGEREGPGVHPGGKSFTNFLKQDDGMIWES